MSTSALEDVEVIDGRQLIVNFNHDMQLLFSDPSNGRLVMWVVREGIVNEAFEFSAKHLSALSDWVQPIRPHAAESDTPETTG